MLYGYNMVVILPLTIVIWLENKWYLQPHIGNITIIYTMNNASHVSNVFQLSQPDFGLDERYR